jgi:hypothetical protein
MTLLVGAEVKQVLVKFGFGRVLSLVLAQWVAAIDSATALGGA